MSEEEEEIQDWTECPLCGRPGCRGECLADDDNDYLLDDEEDYFSVSTTHKAGLDALWDEYRALLPLIDYLSDRLDRGGGLR